MNRDYLSDPTGHLLKLYGPYGFPATNVRLMPDISTVLQTWTAHLARELLRLGVFFDAAGIMARVPGPERYKPIAYDDDSDMVPDVEYDPAERLADVDHDTVYTILAECLKRVGAEYLLEDIFVTAKRLDRLPDEWKTFLDAQDDYNHAYQNVIAECLNVLLIVPGMAEIDAQTQTTWWQAYWAHETKRR